MPPAVSINLCCYNGEEYLEETLESIFAQTHKDWELVIINDGSIDSTDKIIKKYTSQDQPIVYHYQKNAGLGAARNKALELSSGSNIAFIDQDDLWLPTKLEKQAAALYQHPEIDFVYANYFNLKNKQLAVALRGKQPQGDVFENFLSKYPVGLLTVMLRKKALDELDQIFDDNLMLLEEYDVFMRLLYKSRAVYLGDPLAVYRIHPDMTSIKRMKSYPDEWTYLINKFKRVFPLFESNYKKGFHFLKAQIAICQAKIEMMQNDNKSARYYLHPYKLISLSFFLLYLETYFSSNVWNRLIRMKNKFRLTSSYQSLSVQEVRHIIAGRSSVLCKKGKASKR